MSSVQVNGNVPHSAFIEHMLAYPAVNDGLSTFKSNPYGQRSLEITDSLYKTFAAPFIPYLAKPFQYVSPYVKKADDIGDKTLSRVEEKFPVVKKPTNEIINDAKTIVLFPMRIGQTGKEHVFNTYDTERRKVGDKGILGFGKAALTTTLIIATDTFTTVSNYLGSGKSHTRQAVEEKVSSK